MLSNLRRRSTSLFGTALSLALVLLVATTVSAQGQSAGVNDGHGKEWMHLPSTAGVSWNATAQACPQDGIAPCEGTIAGRDVNKWVWATDSQVLQLLSYFDTDLLTNRFVEGFAHFGSAQSFLSAFRPTHSFCIT
ncbi:MAG TPA: hypothetical protein VJS64_02295, partial [Pyrinomonadaceae bacterium]|nr:hypothetical protein [Pyrinomonadaceae bacterium]